MKKTIIALTLLLNSFALMGASEVETKTEVELKVALTQKAFNALKAAFIANKFKLEESERTDYYFDVFENGRYVLRELPQPVKLRFKQDEEELKWQNQKVVKTGVHTIFSIKTTESSEIEMDHEAELMKSINTYFIKLSNVDPAAITQAEHIQKTLLEKKILEDSDNKYFPTHTNHKKRVKLKLKIEQDQFSVLLGETNNRGVVSYELEAEIKKSTDVNKSAERLNLWLQSLGFNSSYIDISVQVDPTDWSEKILNELFVLGVQNF